MLEEIKEDDVEEIAEGAYKDFIMQATSVISSDTLDYYINVESDNDIRLNVSST